KYRRQDWYPTEAPEEAAVVQWLMVAESEIARGPNDARLHDKFGYQIDVAGARAKAGRILEVLEQHLSTRDWLEVGRPTIADIACFPYVALSHEGGVSLEPYRAVRGWVDRIKALPDFTPMPAI
ncbi:glutathione S-transferase C-terminal domain-containing protein, partial [Erythrobacter sp. QSSC1-22B]|uniref:glutathione S-transferase C-terminal domain-containing protein n=1 Tax=Erythrobacter sp. QSSC1-22B TaxID=1860125 RepID=UPI000B082186